jgi:ubiquinone/menaquinone biosynthesis C-methylase UbiE
MLENDEATRAWNTILFDKFVRFQYLLTTGLSHHGDALLAKQPPAVATRLLDIGCGFGDMTQRLARALGSSGEAVGVDVAQNFVDSASRDAAKAGTSNARFFRADVQVDDLGGPYDAAYARFGTMFFASPVAAFRNVRRALVPSAPLAMVVWRKREDNPWLYTAEQCVRAIVPEEHPDPKDEPTCGPGPFSMRGPDLVSDQLLAAGFRDIAFQRNDADICIGRTLEEAIEFAMALGPAGELIRLAGDVGRAKTPEVVAALKDALAVFQRPEGLFAPSSTWLVTARA